MQIPLAFAMVLTATMAAQATSVVSVVLGDPDDANAMTIKLDKTSAKAGPVEFDVANVSKATVHEMLVVPVKRRNQALPYDAKKDAVDEGKIKSLGETSDLEAGQKKSLTLDLKPGSYYLLCNQTGHYMRGMKTVFTVTK